MEQDSHSLEKTGRAILKRMHQHYISESLDDTEFIPFVKAVLQGVADRMTAARRTDGQIEDMRLALKEYCKELYVDEWVKNREEGEAIDAAREEGENHFEYLFKHGKHPSRQR
jgi:hypothetical protein